MSSSSSDIEARVQEILKKYPVLFTIDEKLKLYEARIGQTVKNPDHIKNAGELRTQFNMFLGVMAQASSDKPGMQYADFNKWRTASVALQSFSKFANQDRMIDKEIKISSTSRELSYDQMIIEVRALLAGFSVTVQSELIRASSETFQAMEKQDTRAEMGKRDTQIEALKRENERLTAPEDSKLGKAERRIRELESGGR